VLSYLLDGDASRLVLLGLGHNNAQDAILEFSRDILLVDMGGEVKAARELADGALSEPVLRLVSGLLLGHLGLLLMLGYFGASLVGSGLLFILNSSVVRVLMFLTALGDSTLFLTALDKSSGWSAGSIGTLSLAADLHRLRLGEFDLNIFFTHAGKLSMKLIGLSSLADIELRLPVTETTAASAVLSLVLTRVAVKVVKETEERGKGSIGVVKVAREESHCVCFFRGLCERGSRYGDSV
jgi:hypothetical protein